MAKANRWSIIIRKSAAYDDVTVYFGDEFVQVDLSKLSWFDKSAYLSRLINWGLDGYKGNPPSLKG